jgi:hypothetical protein
MAAYEYNPFEGPLCSFEEAILWVAHRDVAQIRGASSLFSLREWPDEVTKGFWRLLRELARERQPIRSFVPGGQPVEAAFYRQAWSALKAEEARVGQTRTLPIDENLARRVDGLEGMRVIRSVTTTFRNFIRAAESILGFIGIDIDTDSLTQTFPVPDPRPPPVEPEPEPSRHSDEEEAAPPESEPAPPGPEPKPVRKRRPKMKRRQIQLAVALKKCKLENSTLSDAALASVLQRREPSLKEISPSTLFVVRRDFKELIAQAEKHEGN